MSEDRDIDVTEPKLTDDDERWAKAERIFADIVPGWRLSIHRQRPNWCSGYLERIEVTEDEVLDLDYIIERWGGQVLRLRLCDETGTYRRGADLNLRSYPPRFKGRIIRENEDDWYEDNGSGRTARNTVQNPSPPQQSLDLPEVLSALQKHRQSDLNTLMQLLTPQTQQIAPVQPHNPLDDIIETAQKWKLLQSLMGSPDTQSQSDGDEGALNYIKDIVTMLKTNAPQNPPRSRVVAPVQTADNTQNQQTIGQSVAPKNGDMTEDLSNLPPHDFSKTFLTALSKMRESDRIEAIQDVVESMGLSAETPADFEANEAATDQIERQIEPE